MLCCLPYFLPFKIGKWTRVGLLFPLTLALAYVVTWVLIFKGLNFATENVELSEDGLLFSFWVTNKSFGDIKLVDLNFYNQKKKKVHKESDDLPMKIASRMSEPLGMLVEMDEYETVEIIVKILGLQRKIKAKMRKAPN